MWVRRRTRPSARREPNAVGAADGQHYEPTKIIWNFLTAVAGEGVSKGAAFVTTVVVARSVGEADFGRFSFVLALVSFALLLTDVGLQIAGTRAIAADRRRAAQYVTGALVMGAAFGAAAYAALVGAAVVGLLPYGVATAVGIFAIVLVLAAGINAYWSLLRGLERQDLVYLSYSLSSVALLGAAVVVAALRADVETFFAVYVASYALRLVVTLVLVRAKVMPFRWRLDAAVVRTLALAAPAVALAYILQEVYSHVDVVLLGFLVRAEEVGAYAAAYRLVDAVTFLTAGAATAAVFPVFSRLAREAPDKVARLYNRVTSVMAAALVPVVVLLAAFAGPVVDLVYGFESREAGRLLALLAPSVLLIPLNFTTMFLALAIGLTRAAIVAAGTAAAVNIAANLVFVPAFGVATAPVTTLVAEVVMLVTFRLALARAGFPSEAVRAALVAAAIIAPLLALAVAFPDGRLAVGLGGAVVGTAAARMTGLVRPRDLSLLREAVRPS